MANWPNYFPDGYTQSSYIAAVPRLHDELRFAYRPVLIEERNELAALAQGPSRTSYARHAAALIAERLIEWNLRDAAADPLEVTATNILRLHPQLFQKLLDVVLGLSPSDIDPTWSEEQTERIVEERELAAAKDISVGEVRQEQAEKN